MGHLRHTGTFKFAMNDSGLSYTIRLKNEENEKEIDFCNTVFENKAFKGVPDGIKGVFVGAMETNNTSHRLGTDIKNHRNLSFRLNTILISQIL